MNMNKATFKDIKDLNKASKMMLLAYVILLALILHQELEIKSIKEIINIKEDSYEYPIYIHEFNTTNKTCLIESCEAPIKKKDLNTKVNLINNHLFLPRRGISFHTP